MSEPALEGRVHAMHCLQRDRQAGMVDEAGCVEDPAERPPLRLTESRCQGCALATRQRHRPGVRDLIRGRDGLPFPGCCSDPPQSAVVKDILNCEEQAGLTRLRDKLQGPDRVRARGEKVVVGGNYRTAQDTAPDLREGIERVPACSVSLAMRDWLPGSFHELLAVDLTASAEGKPLHDLHPVGAGEERELRLSDVAHRPQQV